MNESPIVRFLEAVRRRLNRSTYSRLAGYGLVTAGGLCLAWALAWRIAGYAAPRLGYGVIVFWIAVFFAYAGWLASRSQAEAASSADRLFGLKDGLLSWLGFRGRESTGEAYELHEKSMLARVAALDPATVPVAHPRRHYLIGGVLALLAGGLACLPHSAAVRERIAREELTAHRSAEVRKQVEQAVEELIKELSDEERKALDPAKLLELAKQLKETKDQREAEKQIARFEQELAKAMQGLEARQDEAVLKLAADELAKSSMADVRQLGKQLDAKDFEKAKEDLEEMKPDAKPKMTPEQLEQLRKNAAKAKEASKRMADGARKRDFGKTPKSGDPRDGAAMQPGDNQKPMQEMLDELDAQARELDQKLEQGELDPDAQEMAESMAGKMGELGKRLGKLDARQKARGKLNALRQGMADARQFSQGQSQTLGLAQSMMQGQRPGGREAGKGSVESRRDAKDELKDNGNLAEVKGQANGEGPSSKTVESAESGTGIAGRAAVDRQREFRRQMESLVRRDDIPEELKLGVREYFERVHETGEEPQK